MKTIKNLLMGGDEGDLDLTNLYQAGLPVFQQVLYRAFCYSLAVVIPPHALALLLFRHYELGILHLLIAPLYIYNAWCLLRRDTPLLSPGITLASTCLLFVAVFASGFHYIIYLAFCLTATFYVILEPRMARIANLVWVLTLGLISFRVFSVENTASLISSLIITGFLIDISAAILRRQEHMLEQLTVRDPLTNAYNRRALMESLEQAIALHDRYNTPTSLVMLDIDHFKNVNDSFGHREGDTALKNLVTALGERLRKTDRLCRYGGEEFVIVLNGITLEQAVQLAETFCEQLRNNQLIPQTPLTISCGVAEIQQGETSLDWLHRCDELLYQAKDNGRDQVVSELSQR